MENREKAAPAPLVLIANDQEWSARSLESILGPSGYSVVRAYTGQQALERAGASLPDLIILDAQMPDMHGFDVCRALRADPRFSSTTPIVITTSGPSGRTQRLEAYRAGAWEFLGQPLDGESLLLKLGTFLQCKQAVDELREENLLDTNTGLYNMRGLSRRAREIGSDALRRHDPLACVVFAPNPRVKRPRMGMGRSRRFPTRWDCSSSARDVPPTPSAVSAPRSSPSSRRPPGRTPRCDSCAGCSGAIEGSPVAHRGGERAIRIRAGYCAVPDFAQSPVDAVELLLRATTALRDLRREGRGERIRAFEQVALECES